MNTIVTRVLRPRRVVRVVAALAFASGFAAGARAQQTDTILTKDDKTLNVKVTAENYNNIEFQEKQAKRNLTWDNVVSVKYGDKEFNAVVDKIAAAPIADSLQGLERLLGDDKLRPVLKQQGLKLVASLKAQQGDWDGTIAGWQALLKEFPGGRFLDDATRGVVDACLAKGAAAEASKLLDQAVADTRSGNPGARYDATVALLKARILFAQGNFSGAKAAYDAADKAGNLAPDQKATASLGVAKCQQKAGQTADAESRYRALVTGPDTPRYVLAGAWNGLGDIYLDQGRKNRAPDTLIQALYDYLRGVVLYVPLEGEPRDEHVNAIQGAAACCDGIADLDPNAKQLYRQRAAALKQRLADPLKPK